MDRRALSALGFGHLCSDLTQGALPALLPFLAARRGYSYAALGALVLAASVGSSIVQPLFGLVADRVRAPFLMPIGVLVGGTGIALVGLAPSYPLTVAAVALGGLGVAAFHPEGARYANLASGAARARGMSLFSLGGNAGFALGPLLATPLVLAFGLAGTLGLVVLPALAAVVLARGLPRLEGHALAHAAALARDAARGGAGRPRARDDWGAFSRLGGIVALRSSMYFGLQTFVPAYFVGVLGATEALGNGALTAMLVAGAVGTLTGGVVADRIGPRRLLVGSLALLVPLAGALPLAGAAGAVGVLVLIGFVAIATFSVTVVLGQAYLPTRLGVASGVTLGLAIGVGGLASAGFGVLADAAGVRAVLWVIAALPLPALALALTLPELGRPHAATASPPAREPELAPA